jgi:hypothetical protein
MKSIQIKKYGRSDVIEDNNTSENSSNRNEKKKHRNLKEIFILSLELTISMVLVGGALMVAINGMSAGSPMP